MFRDSGKRLPRAAFDALKRQGFSIARFVLFWDRAEPSRGSFSASYFAALDGAIADACAPTTSASGARVPGVRVVLDAIHLFGPAGGMSYVPAWAKAAGGDSVTVVPREGLPFLRMLARRYRDNPCVTALEPVNEPFRYPVNNTAVLRMFNGLIGQIRAQAPKMTVVIEPSYGDTDSGAGCADFSALTRRDNVVWSFHDYYLGGAGDGYASDCSQEDRKLYAWNGVNPYLGGRAADIRAHVQRAVSGPRAAGLPVWVGEFGIGLPGREAWIKDTLDAFRALRLGSSWWEWSTRASFSATDAAYRLHPWAGALTR